MHVRAHSNEATPRYHSATAQRLSLRYLIADKIRQHLEAHQPACVHVSVNVHSFAVALDSLLSTSSSVYAARHAFRRP